MIVLRAGAVDVGDGGGSYQGRGVGKWRPSSGSNNSMGRLILSPSPSRPFDAQTGPIESTSPSPRPGSDTLDSKVVTQCAPSWHDVGRYLLQELHDLYDQFVVAAGIALQLICRDLSAYGPIGYLKLCNTSSSLLYPRDERFENISSEALAATRHGPASSASSWLSTWMDL